MKSGGEQHRMDELKQIGEMIYSNVQWIFSGIGVAVISILGGKAAVKKVKRKQKAKNQGVNISSDKDINSENILTQTAGENSKNLNVMGDYHEVIKMHDRLHWMFLKPIRQYTQKLPKKQLMKELLILQMIFLQ